MWSCVHPTINFRWWNALFDFINTVTSGWIFPSLWPAEPFANCRFWYGPNTIVIRLLFLALVMIIVCAHLRELIFHFHTTILAVVPPFLCVASPSSSSCFSLLACLCHPERNLQLHNQLAIVSKVLRMAHSIWYSESRSIFATVTHQMLLLRSYLVSLLAQEVSIPRPDRWPGSPVPHLFLIPTRTPVTRFPNHFLITGLRAYSFQLYRNVNGSLTLPSILGEQ